MILSIYPPLHVPEGGGHRHVHEHRSGESLSGALWDHIWNALHREAGHGLQAVHCHVEVLREGADMIHGRHLDKEVTSKTVALSQPLM